jgi:glycosyltransferase involved in cell wall biosynthesis
VIVNYPLIDSPAEAADICLVVEGAYPYVWGGVSHWVQRLVRAQKRLSFHIVAVTADDRKRTPLYRIPPNVLGIHHVPLQRRAAPEAPARGTESMVRAVEPALSAFLHGGGREELRQLGDAFARHHESATLAQLLNSEAAYEMAQRMYERSVPGSSFLHYFWSWRALVGGLCSVMLAKLPRARVYHAVSTGYAGLAMARASIQSNRPGMLTEHGIYTHERRIEVAMADWLRDAGPASLAVTDRPVDLRDIWMSAFGAFSRAAYESANRIVSLYGGAQAVQQREGASPTRMTIIPNGVDVDRYVGVRRGAPRTHPPTVALMGRVVPVKDIKTFVRAIAQLREQVPKLRAQIYGARDEDPGYARECADMVSFLGLDDCVEFKGHVETRDALAQVDVLVLTSLSEAQPLVLLEAGAAGIPCVVTDVGACREIVLGRQGEYPALGAGGFVTPLANPRATAQAVGQLLRDEVLRARCGRALQTRVRRYYNRRMVDAAYAEVYARQIAMSVPVPAATEAARA